MPTIDVSDALGFENFDTFVITSSVMTIGLDGVATVEKLTPVVAYGVIVPIKASALRRTIDGTRLDASIDIYTRTPITEGYKTSDTYSVEADVVDWHGRNWVVAMIEDYSSFGKGFLHATADLVTVNANVREPQRS